MTIYVGVLSIAGTLQGLTWAGGDPFIASLQAAAPYWEARAVSGTMMFVAHCIFAYNVWKMTLGPQTSTVARQAPLPAGTPA